MRIKTFLLIAALGLPAIAAADDTKSKPTEKGRPTEQAKLSSADQAIIAHVHHVNLMELDLGKLAEKHGSPAVKKYAEQLVRDHGASNKTVAGFAKARGVAAIPEEKPTTEAERKDMQASMERVAKLKKLKGADFDREFLAIMVQDHDSELAKIPPAIASTTDADVKKLLEDVRSMMQRHADAARELQKSTPQATTEKSSSSKTMSAPK